MRVAVLTLIAVVLTSSVALANPPSMTLPDEPPPAAPAGPQKSEGTARALAVVGALTGPVVMMIGARLDNGGSTTDLGESISLAGAVISILGPSAGHWYAGKIFTTGMGLRVLGVAAEVAGLVMVLDCAFDENSDCNSGAGGAVLVIAGAGLYVGGTIYDIATADDAARAWNRRHSEGIRLTPMPLASKHGGGLGLALTGTF